VKTTAFVNKLVAVEGRELVFFFNPMFIVAVSWSLDTQKRIKCLEKFGRAAQTCLCFCFFLFWNVLRAAASF
jgi:hypothetical protein